MMYANVPFMERVKLAKADGVDAVEFWKWSDKDIPALIEEMKRLDLKAAVMNLESSDPSLSARLLRGILSHRCVDEFVGAIRETAPVMRALGMDRVIVLVGDKDPEIPFEKVVENTLETLRVGVKAAEDEGMTLVLEPLNTVDRPSYVMPFCRDAFAIVKEIGSPNLKLLLDLYHTQRMEGNLIETLQQNIGCIGHFHVANVPFRCEPDLGEVDYRQVFSAIEKTGYEHYVGFEYRQKNPAFRLGDYLKTL